MPNHVHAVVVLENKQTDPVGAALRGGPKGDNKAKPPTGDHIGSPLQVNNPSLSRVMDWYKTMTTNAYIRGVKENNWKRFNGQLWQRSFYDHIIRTDRTLDNIREYISTNPAKWELDAENRKNNMDKEKYYKKLYE